MIIRQNHLQGADTCLTPCDATSFLVLCCIRVAIKLYTGYAKINTDQFRKFCINTYTLIFSSFNNSTKWINISPTLHSLLAHGWEIVSNHDDRGMGEFTESGLENSNKFLRFYRGSLARKTTQSSNLEDCLSRLWQRSDPVKRACSPHPQCK